MTKKYICISVYHSYHGNGWWLWRPNGNGYTGDISGAGEYTPNYFKDNEVPVVKMRKDLCRYYYKKYNSVLVDKDEFISYTNDLKNCKNNCEIDNIKAILYGLECILTSENIEPRIRIEKALARINHIRRSN
jgi:hypothetical protein